jgi:hypothetical protein
MLDWLWHQVSTGRWRWGKGALLDAKNRLSLAATNGMAGQNSVPILLPWAERVVAARLRAIG